MITIEHTNTGYYHIRGVGPCNWCQLPMWPCDEATIRASAFPEAAEYFLREVIEEARRLLESSEPPK